MLTTRQSGNVFSRPYAFFEAADGKLESVHETDVETICGWWMCDSCDESFHVADVCPVEAGCVDADSERVRVAKVLDADGNCRRLTCPKCDAAEKSENQESE